MRKVKRRLTIRTKLHFMLPFLSPIFGGLLIIFGIFLITFVTYSGDPTLKLSYKEHVNKLQTVYESPITVKDNLRDDYLLNTTNLWFMKNGWIKPENISSSHDCSRKPLWPYDSDTDRIVEQLMFVPPNLDQITENRTKLKKILIYDDTVHWKSLTPGQDIFVKDNCPVSTCNITVDRDEAAKVDAIIFRDYFLPSAHKRLPSQIWILHVLESPLNFKILDEYTGCDRNAFNWTATYRHDSDIVTPYGKFVPYNANVKFSQHQRNYAENKTGKVAWFVSNCEAQNDRLHYALQLSNYIEVDIYGYCGSKWCGDDNDCFVLLNTTYKFYLSFENANCKEYITEKFFVNGLSHNVVPIVMGARKEDYLRVAPPNSFIFVDDFKSAHDLANYLNFLDKNDELYSQYFRWKGTGEFINTYFWCRLCAMLHDKQIPQAYFDLDLWWNNSATCVKQRWWGTRKKNLPELKHFF